MPGYAINNHPSWYPTPVLNKETWYYLKSLEKIFMVFDADRKMVPYKLAPHQIHWHSFDVALLKHRAPTRVVVKSRNTSFTTSCLISNLMDVPSFKNQIKPFVRINEQRAIDLLREDLKPIIENMRPIRLKNGKYYPFDPRDVDFSNIRSGVIHFPGNVDFRAFPATKTAADNIRGFRIAGSAGMLDEAEMMPSFEDIYISARDASSGKSFNGRQCFQVNIGTTLKGPQSPFYLWYTRLKGLGLSNIKVFHWPLFNPKKFNMKVPVNQQNITPIVPWHDLESIESKRVENHNRFLQEYMCEVGDMSEAFYPHHLTIRCIDSELLQWEIPKNKGIFYMGVDVASVHDFFAISIFEKIDDEYIQRYIFYKRDVELDDMEDLCRKLLRIWEPIRCRIDANGIGFQLAQTLQKEFGAKVNPVRGRKIKGLEKKQNLSINEFMHTNLKTLMIRSKVKLISDEMQVIHMGVWDYNFKADSTDDYGHGDICIANALALLPINYKVGKRMTPVATNLRNDTHTKELPNAIVPDVEW